MAYLTVNEYLDRVGEAETIRLTDEERTGAVDTAKVDKALDDASEEVDAYLGRRYSTPLVSPPNLVKSMVAAIAREDLHKTRAPEAVTADAERARAQLRDIAKGVMILPTGTGPASEDAKPPLDSAASGEGSTSSVFNDDSLAGFGIPTGYAGACWRN